MPNVMRSALKPKRMIILLHIIATVIIMGSMFVLQQFLRPVDQPEKSNLRAEVPPEVQEKDINGGVSLITADGIFYQE